MLSHTTLYKIHSAIIFTILLIFVKSWGDLDIKARITAHSVGSFDMTPLKLQNKIPKLVSSLPQLLVVSCSADINKAAGR